MKNDKQVNVALMLVAMLLIIVQPFLELQVVRAAVTTIFPSKIVTGTVYQGIPNSVDILEEIAGVGGYDSGDQTNTAYVKFNLPSNYDYSNAKLSLTPIPGSDSGGDISNLTINIGSSDDWIVTDGNTYPLTSLPSKKVGIEKDFSKPTYSFNNFDSPILLPIGDLLTEQNINDIGSSNIITLILSSPNMKDDYAVFNNISLVDFNTSPQVKHTVSFETDGGSAVPSQSVVNGGMATMPEVEPTKAGYTFGGWYKDVGYTQTYDFTSVITENTTIYAKWNAQTYIVSFNTDGGSAVSNQSVAHGEKASEPTPAPTKVGYTFGGWYTSNTLEKLFDFESSSITRNITIYAKWVSNVSPPTSNNSSNSDSFTPTTNTERIVVEVEGEDGVNLSKTPITRTTIPDGVIKDHVSMSEDIAKETIEKAKQLGNDFARIIIPDTTDKVSEVVIEIPKSSLVQLSFGNIKLEMATANVVISIPDLSNFNDDLYFRLVPIKSSEQQHRVEERIVEEDIIKNSIQSEKVHLIGRPMTIETNMQNRPVTLTLPLPKTITQEQLDNLAIFIEHSDGTKELLRGKVVDYQKDMQGLQFEVQKFSTFSILYLPEKRKVEEPTTNHVTHIPYIQGNSDGTFRPNASVTRAQMASMFARQLTGNAIPTSKATFTDTVQHDAKDAIEFVKNTGLFNGVTETSFHPNGFITRAQMASVAARWIEKHCANNPNADFCKPTSQGRVFKDVSNNHWAVQAINTVNARGIMTGTMADAFDPEVYLTRAQAVKVLNRLFERQAVTELQQPIFKDVPSDHWAFNEIQEAAVKHIHSK
ncbi:InlB B-repeat-containing protein [Lysinibacillus fusiformis]|uniref:SLH domain-containing protein n=1 Tax=Lysinibacillus fusiformis TaxID=28031 RepID=A0A1E4R1U9_9BACI|nr:InlB B-repeat-containing protein [Lysinibacillus fusiformis]ODV54434.1 hypothetical protein BG258_00270 [Lysinibacillus fusiformis]